MPNEESGIGLAADLEDCGNLLENLILLPEPRIGVEALLDSPGRGRRELAVQIRRENFLIGHFGRLRGSTPRFKPSVQALGRRASAKRWRAR